MTSKGEVKLAFLKSFDLIDLHTNNVKVVASFLQKQSFELTIENKDGLSIYQESFDTDQLNLAMGFSNLPDGEYFISLKTSDGVVVKKFK